MYDEWKVKREKRDKDGYEGWNENIRSFERDEPYSYNLKPNSGDYRRHHDERRYYDRQKFRHYRGKYYDRSRLHNQTSYRRDPWNERNRNKNGDHANFDGAENFYNDTLIDDGSSFVFESFNTEQLAGDVESIKHDSNHTTNGASEKSVETNSS